MGEDMSYQTMTGVFGQDGHVAQDSPSSMIFHPEVVSNPPPTSQIACPLKSNHRTAWLAVRVPPRYSPVHTP